jgi:hypothetical protein
MAVHSTYHVVFHEDDRTWRVHRTGSFPAVVAHRTKEEAVEIGIARARASFPSHLVVHGSDGSVEREQSFVPPYPQVP